MNYCKKLMRINSQSNIWNVKLNLYSKLLINWRNRHKIYVNWKILIRIIRIRWWSFRKCCLNFKYNLVKSNSLIDRIVKRCRLNGRDRVIGPYKVLRCLMRANHTWLIVKGAHNKQHSHPTKIWDKACNLIELTKTGHTAQAPLLWKWRRLNRTWTTCRRRWKPNY